MADALQRAGQQAARNGKPVPAPPGGFSLTTPHPDPGIEAVRQQLQADHTRKTQEAADQRRDAEAMMAQAQQLQQQALTAIQQVNQTAASMGSPQQETQQYSSFAEDLESQFGTQIDDQSKAVLNALAEHSSARSDALEAQVAKIAESVGQLTDNVNNGQASIRAIAQRPEIDRLTELFGSEEINKLAPQIGQLMNANPSMTVEQALAATDPVGFAKAHADHAVKEQQAQMQTERSQLFQNLGELEGVTPEPSGGQGDGDVPLESGESFMDSVKANVGQTGLNHILTQGALDSAQ